LLSLFSLSCSRSYSASVYIFCIIQLIKLSKHSNFFSLFSKSFSARVSYFPHFFHFCLLFLIWYQSKYSIDEFFIFLKFAFFLIYSAISRWFQLNLFLLLLLLLLQIKQPQTRPLFLLRILEALITSTMVTTLEFVLYLILSLETTIRHGGDQ
jgi:hypothetical protein